MANKLRDLLNMRTATDAATKHGAIIHKKLQFVFVDDNVMRGDMEICKIVANRDDLKPLFTTNSRTEVPLAGVICGRFVSRRIDRLNVNHESKTIDVLDYKSDINPDIFRDKYISQIGEYIELLRQIYPDYTIGGFILWVHDWTLEKIY